MSLDASPAKQGAKNFLTRRDFPQIVLKTDLRAPTHSGFSHGSPRWPQLPQGSAEPGVCGHSPARPQRVGTPPAAKICALFTPVCPLFTPICPLFTPICAPFARAATQSRMPSASRRALGAPGAVRAVGKRRSESKSKPFRRLFLVLLLLFLFFNSLPGELFARGRLGVQTAPRLRLAKSIGDYAPGGDNAPGGAESSAAAADRDFGEGTGGKAWGWGRDRIRE